ncbi:YrrS family protein [Bacillaceae bacterium C204]|uniref:YrrS family protein n=1 Tax=Neobacillus sp. 204 TaxID=3383351 RepID=UPI003979B96C
MTNDFTSNSRSGNRAKRKKTNIVLNGLIIVVLLLIIFVAYNIFATGNDNASQKNDTTKTEQKATEQKDTEQKETDEVTSNGDDNVTDSAAEEDAQSEETSTQENSETPEDATVPEDADKSQEVVTEGDGTNNVVRVTENPSWQPVGTSQTGEHTAVYDQSSVDWQEMLNAISYATGLDKGNMTVYWLGRDKSTTNGSFSTVASKDNQHKYNVYLQWVDGQGWKPTKVEELAEIDQ